MVLTFLGLNNWILPDGEISSEADIPKTWERFVHRFLYYSTSGIPEEPRLWEMLRLIAVADRLLCCAQMLKYDEVGFGLLLSSGLISFRGRWLRLHPDIRQTVREHMSYQQQQVARRSLQSIHRSPLV